MNNIIRLKRLLGQIDIRQAVAVLLFALLASCASVESDSTGGVAEAESQPEKPEQAETTLSTSAAQLAQAGAQEEPLAPVLYRGTDQLVNVPPVREPVRFVGEDVSLNFEQAPLSEVVHAIVGDILKLDYIVDGAIKGQVTLRTRNPIPRNQLLGVLESLLQANGSLMIAGSDGRYLITSSPQATQLNPGISNPESLSPGYSTIIVPLQFISASNMAEILRPMASESALVRVDNSRNLMMLAGTRAQLSGWLDIVNTFDVDLLEGMSVGMFPLEHSTVEETAMALNGLIAAGAQGGAGNLTQVVRVIPVERLNSLLVVTPRSRYLDTIGRWVSRLDVVPHSNFEKSLFVYPVQNTTASRLATLLNSIYSGGGSGGGRRGSAQSSFDGNIGGAGGGGGGVAPGLTQETSGEESGGKFAISGGGSAQALTTAFGGGKSSDSPLEDVRVVADDENNALMIYATGSQYSKIEDALAQLDVVATQVLIEASIIEVSLTDELKYGLEWTFKNGLGSGYDGSGLLDLDETSGLGPSIPGFSYTITNSIGDVSAVLNALSEDGLVNVISTPSVMVLDNHQAYIHVGEQVPVEGQNTVTDGGTTTRSIDYRDTGVKLTVRPSVNAGGLVTMDLAQSITDVGERELAGNRRFLERLIESRVAVRSNESVVLGGLIRERAARTEAGVPILHKLPLIGPLFGTVQNEDSRTELMVIITPRVLYNEAELRALSEEMRAQVRHLELLKLGEE